jgi:hypothetical protein
MDLNYILLQTRKTPLTHRLNAAKEALQQCMLAALAQQGLLADVAFIGGTALRILHRLPRYSEDMDFVWMGAPPSVKQLQEWPATIRRALTKIGLTPHINTAGPTTVDALVHKQSFTLYLSVTSPAFAAFARSGVQISFEIDLNPPDNTRCESRTLVVANSQLTVPTLTLPSLLAGKLHILLTRRDREKGRDWYDYLWYRRNEVLPNVLQLQSAIAQTSDGPEARFWMSHLRARMKAVQWENIRHDVRPFLEYPEETTQLNERGLINLTPHPSFKEIVQELHALKASHPLITKTDNEPVLADLNQAALEGDLDAIEARGLIARLRA